MDTVNPRRCFVEERRLFLARGPANDVFQRIPEWHVATGAAVKRIIAFHHAAVSSKRFDRSLDEGFPGRCQLHKADRIRSLLEAESPKWHAEAADLAHAVGAAGDFQELFAPS